jgi:osmotically inducible protein OsmC
VVLPRAGATLRARGGSHERQQSKRRLAGGLKDGKGTITAGSGAFSAMPYDFRKRFEGEPWHQSRGADRRGARELLRDGPFGRDQQAGQSAEQLDSRAEW